MSKPKTKPTKTRGVKRLPDGRYLIRAYAIDPKTGRERETRQIVEASSVGAAAAIRSSARRDLVAQRAEKARRRLADFAASWLAGKRSALKASTLKTYAEALDLHILPALGDFYVDAITLDDLVRWRDAQAGKAASINCRVRVLKTVLRDAIEDLQLDRDPTVRFKTVRAPQTTSEDDGAKNSLSAEELRAVLGAVKARDPSWYPLVLTLALTGLRFGEATALRWGDVDEEHGCIRVRRAQWNGIVDTPKTESSRRTVALPDELRDVLAAHRRGLVERQAPGVASGYVFTSSAGTLLFSSVMTKPIRRALKAAGVERPFVAAHGFRHTFNNLVRQVAEGQVVRALTGHSEEAMTEHYSHVSLEEKRAAVARVLRLVRVG